MSRKKAPEKKTPELPQESPAAAGPIGAILPREAEPSRPRHPRIPHPQRDKFRFRSPEERETLVPSQRGAGRNGQFSDVVGLSQPDPQPAGLSRHDRASQEILAVEREDAQAHRGMFPGGEVDQALLVLGEQDGRLSDRLRVGGDDRSGQGKEGKQREAGLTGYVGHK